MTLDKFLYKHTSEDNESFSEIMVETENRRREKQAWLYSKEGQQREVNYIISKVKMHPLITEYGGYLARQITAETKGVYSGSQLARAKSHSTRAPADSV